MGWPGHVAHVGILYSIVVGKPEGKRLLEKPDIGGRIILKLIFKD
jgi:hypothetical protein